MPMVFKVVCDDPVRLMAQSVFTNSYFIHTCGPSAGTTVDTILQEFRDDILNNVNAKECAPELRRQRVIAESTETDIERARGVRKASGILYDHLRMNCTYEQIVVFSQVLMKVDDGLGKTKNVGYRLHARIQESGAVASEQKVSQDESQLHPATPKVEVKTGNISLSWQPRKHIYMRAKDGPSRLDWDIIGTKKPLIITGALKSCYILLKFIKCEDNNVVVNKLALLQNSSVNANTPGKSYVPQSMSSQS